VFLVVKQVIEKEVEVLIAVEGRKIGGGVEKEGLLAVEGCKIGGGVGAANGAEAP
jgi:hypothetical protein